MRSCLLSLTVLALAANAAQAHFIFIVPDGPAGSKAKMIFSENLEPDNPSLLAKIAKTKVYVRNVAGKVTPLSATPSDDGLIIEVAGDGPHTIGGVCNYGVLQRGQAKPFLLNYYAKAVLGAPKSYKPWETLALDIVPTISAGEIRFQVLYNGRPVQDAEVIVHAPGAADGAERKTDAKGEVAIGAPGAGRYGIRARHIEARSGELDGKKYEEVRHYSTLVLHTDAASAAVEVSKAPTSKKAKLVEDPAATRLLKEARSARAQWNNFPGFTADLEVNVDGKATKGLVLVDAKGNVSFDKLTPEIETWAKRTLGSIVSHRLDGSAELDTPCAFSDDVEDHPLGRAITVLSDELHSSYRVRDKQITVVSREMAASRFSITVLENRQSEEGTFLPATFVVHFWDAKTGALQKTESHAQTWVRVGVYDLPATARVISDAKDLSARSLRLSNHKVIEAAAK